MADIRIRWHLDVVGKSAARDVLSADRALRNSITATDRAYSARNKVAQATERTMTKAVAAEQRANERAARAAATAERRVSALGRTSGTAGAQIERTSRQTYEQAAAYDRVGRAALNSARNEETAARRRRVAARVVGGARGIATGIAGAGAGGLRSAAAVTGGVGIALGLRAVARETIGFDRGMRNVNSIAQLSERRLQRLGSQVRDLAGRTAQAPRTLAAGLYDLVSSNFNAAQSMVVLRSSAKAATAGLTDTETSTRAVAAVINAYHLKAKDAAGVSDVLFQTVNRGVISFETLANSIGDALPYAANLRIPLKDVGAALSTMTKQGLSGEEATTRLKNTFISFIKPGDDMATAIRKTGYESGEALIHAKGYQGALEAVVNTTDGSKGAIAGLFRNIRSIGGALALTGVNTKAAHADLKAFADTTGATDRALKQQSKSISYQWGRVKATFQGLAIELGSGLAPSVNRAMGHLRPLTRELGKIFRDPDLTLGDKIGKSFELIAPKIADAMAAAAPHAAIAFVHAFQSAGIWGQLLTVAFLGKKLGVFGKLGGLAAAAFGKVFGRGKVAGAVGSSLLARGGTPATPLFVRVVGRGGGAVGEGGHTRTVSTGASTAATTSTGAAIKRTALRGEPLTDSVAETITRSPLKSAAGIATLTAAFAGMGRPGVVQTPANVVKQFLNGLGANFKTKNVGFDPNANPSASAFYALHGSSPYGPRPTAAQLARYGTTPSAGSAHAGAQRTDLKPLIDMVDWLSDAAKQVGTKYHGLKNAPFSALKNLPAVPGRGDDMAAWIKAHGAAAKADEYRDTVAAIKPMNKALSLAAGRVTALRGRLAGLKAGTDAYKTTAQQLAGAQAALNGVVRGGTAAFDGVGTSARNAASAMTTAASTIDARVATLAANLRSHGIAFTPAGTAAGRQAQDVSFGPLRRISPGDGGRRGGLAFRGGGLVPAFVSPGEQIVQPDGGTWMVPGTRTAADSVFARLPAGAAVLTSSGQAMIAGGASIGEALAMQAPHFRKGGRVPSAGELSRGDARSSHVHRRYNRRYTAGQAASAAFYYGVRPEHAAIRMGAYAMREGRGNSAAHNYTGRDNSWGPWQVNILPGANPRFASWPLWDFDTGARAMSILHRAGDEKPWGGYSDSTIAPYLAAAARGFSRHYTPHTVAGSPATGRQPLFVGPSRRRAGLLDDAVEQGIEAGASGLSRREIARGLAGARGARTNPIIPAIRQAMTSTSRTVTGTARGADGRGIIGRMNRFAARASKRWPRYVYGGGHSSFTGPYDCSGAVSAILHSGGLLSSPQSTDGLKVYGKPGAGRYISIGVRGTTGTQAHTMIRVGQAYWESSGRGFGRRSGWSGGFPITRHPRGYRRGGTVGGRIPPWIARRLTRRGAQDPHSPNFVGWGLRHGGRVPATGAVALAGATYESLDAGIAGATIVGLDTIRSEVVKVVRRGGTKKVVQKLQGIIDLIDFEIGRRIGRYGDRITQRDARSERATGAADRRLRRSGIDPDSAEGTALIFSRSSAVAGAARADVKDARAALRIARHTGKKSVIRDATQQLHDAQDRLGETLTTNIEQLRATVVSAHQRLLDLRTQAIDKGRAALDRSQRKAGIDPTSAAGLTAQSVGDTLEVAARQKTVTDLKAAIKSTKDKGARSQLATMLSQAQDDLDEALTVQIERRRDLIRATAQERVDTSQFGLDLAQGALANLDVGQRLNRTADTPAGMIERATAIGSTLIPALTAQRDALQQQFADLTSIGDTTGARQAFLAVQQAGTDLAGALADSADLIRQSAEQAAQDTVDRAAHGRTMADLSRAHLELEQRIAGTYDAGGQARADFINSQVVPALTTELAALRAQQSTAAAQGDQALADQIAEAIASKQNDILQATLDATEQVAANTEQKRFGGTLGFTYGNEGLTDAIIAAGNGS